MPCTVPTSFGVPTRLSTYLYPPPRLPPAIDKKAHISLRLHVYNYENMEVFPRPTLSFPEIGENEVHMRMTSAAVTDLCSVAVSHV